MPWLEDLKFPRGYQMGTHIVILLINEIEIILEMAGSTCLFSQEDIVLRLTPKIEANSSMLKFNMFFLINLIFSDNFINDYLPFLKNDTIL